MSNLKKWWKANQVAAVTGVLVLLVVAFPVGSFLKAQVPGDYVPPADTYVPPTDTYVPPTDTYVPPTDTYVPPTDTYVPPTGTYDPCPGDSCPGVCCGQTTTQGYCGDMICNNGEAQASCPSDCGGQTASPEMSNCTSTGGTWCPGTNGVVGYCKQSAGPCETPCPTATPIKCANGTCAVTQLQCGQVTGVCNNNGVCDSGETPANCTSDCNTTTTTCPAATPFKCANGACVTTQAMCTTTTTTACPAAMPIKCANGTCATTQAMCTTTTTQGYCGDMMCNNGETMATCSSDCGTACNNDGICGNGENQSSCPNDCKATTTTNQWTFQCPKGEHKCPDPQGWGGEMCVPDKGGATFCPAKKADGTLNCGTFPYCKDSYGSGSGWCEFWGTSCPKPMNTTNMQTPPMTTADKCPGRKFCGDQSGSPVCVDWAVQCPMTCPAGEQVCTDKNWGGQYCAKSCDQTGMKSTQTMSGSCNGGPCPDGCYTSSPKMEYCADPMGGPGYCAMNKRECMGNTTGPEFNFDRMMCDPRDPFCNNDNQEFQKYESKMDMYVKDEYDTRTVNANEASRELKMVKNEVKNERQWLKDVNREFKKLDWTIQSPVLANAKSMLDEIETLFNEVEGVTTVSTWGEIEQLRDKLNYFRNELRPNFDDVRPQLHVFEELKNFNKEVERMLKDVAKERQRFERENASEECLTFLAGARKALTSIQENPLAGVDTEFFDGRDLWEQLENVRWEHFEPAFECHGNQMQTQWMGQTFDDIARELEKMSGKVPAELEEAYNNAGKLVLKGKECYDKEDFECAQAALDNLERMKGKFERYMGPMGGPKFGRDMGNILGSSFDQDIASILEERIMAKMADVDRLVNSIMDQVMNRMMEQMASVIDQISEQVATTLAKVTENISFAPRAIQEKAAAAEEVKLSAVEEVAAAAEDLTGTAKTTVQNVVDEFAGELWTTETAAELKPQIIGLGGLIENGATNEEIIAEAKEVAKAVEDAREDEQAKRFTEGFVPFADVEPDSWFMGYAHSGKELGHIKGEGGTNDLNPGGELLGAHEVVILARELGVEGTCAEPIASVDGMVDWAKQAVCGLQTKFGSDVFDVLDRPLDQPITREDVAELQVRVLDLPIPSNTAEVLRNFPDRNLMSPEAQDAIAATIEAGIFKGDDSGTFRPQDGMNRAEGVKVNSVAHDIVDSENASLIDPTF